METTARWLGITLISTASIGLVWLGQHVWHVLQQ